MARIQIYSPEGSVDPSAAPTSPTPVAGLAGARIVALDNGKAGAARLLRSMGEQLARASEATFAGVYRKQTAATPCEAPLLDRIATEADIVLTGTAD